MSEYQYYEFQAIDRPLTATEMQELRKISTRAVITKTSFKNEYNFGNLKGNPMKMLEKYFDAYYYTSNFGSHELALKIRKKNLDVKEIEQYFIGESSMKLNQLKEHIIIHYSINDENYADEIYDGSFPDLASLISLRSDIIDGDYRSLYLGYLSCKSLEPKKAKGKEPEIPPNLSKLTATLKSFAEFLFLDSKILADVVKQSKPQKNILDDDELLRKWITSLNEKTKVDIIYSFLKSKSPALQQEILRKFRSGK